MTFLSSGSALERSMICAPSVVLPHARYESPHSDRGVVIHSFLQAVSSVGLEDALEQITEPEYRDVCAELNLDGLHEALSLAAEVSFAYNFRSDTARELGRGRAREYLDVSEDEIPCTLDVVGTRDVASGAGWKLRRGLYVEWKSGWRTRRKIASATQIDFGALVMRRAYDCDVVEGQLVNVYEGYHPHVQRRVIEDWEIDAFASELREHAEQWLSLRAAWRAGQMPRDYETGPWCDWCPAREFCPAQTSQVRALIMKDTFDGLMRMDSIPDSAIAQLWHDIREAKGQLHYLEGKVRGIAASRNIFLGKSADGNDRWLGTVIGEGNDKLDGEAVFDVVASLPDSTWRTDGEPIDGEKVATKATRVTCTKKDLDAAIKDAVPRGKKAETLRAIFAELKKIDGAITNKVNVKIEEFETKPSLETQLQATLDAMTDAEVGCVDAPDVEPTFPEYEQT